jgi:hypothetical protein
MKDWLQKNFKGSWKHLNGGDQHEKDFTIYLGSFATMMSFVRRLDNAPIVNQLDACNAGPEDRIVGDSGKLGARFDTKGTKERKGSFPLYGSNGVPIADRYWHMVLSDRKRAIRLSEELLRENFGDYFCPSEVTEQSPQKN